MSVIEEKCKQKGVRLTEQRRVIAKVMSESKVTFGSKDHPDVDELQAEVKTSLRQIKIISHRDKVEWNLESKYSIGNVKKIV